MPKKIAPIYRFSKKMIRQFETVLFIFKRLLSERHFIYLACVLVAISCSLAVIVLKSFAHYVFVLANYINIYLKLPYINSILPIIGIVLTVLVVKHFLDGKIEKGTSQILFSVARKGGIMPRKQMYAQIITSSLTVGLGGSAGLESPITITGAAFGSNFAQKYRLSQKDRILLLACGVAAGIAAAFNAPIAGVLFAIEVVLTDVTITAFVPIIISAASGALVSQVLLNEDILLSFRQQQTFDFNNIFFYIVLGVLAGFVSVFHARNFRRVEDYFNQYKDAQVRRAFLGSLLLAIMIFISPTLFGEGYESIKILSNEQPQTILDNTLLEPFRDSEWILLIFLGVTMMLKTFAAGITIGSGGNGGNFAPSLFIGSYLGFFVAKFCNLTGIANLPISNFAIVGMAGILSGLFHAPLTAIFLIGEITGGYNLMVPLMIVSSISFAVSKQFENHSLDVKHLADTGDVFTSDRDKNILLNIDVMQLIQNVEALKSDAKISDLVDVIANSDQQLIPVVDNSNNLVGVIEAVAVRKILINPYRLKFAEMSELITQPKAVIRHDEGIENIVEKFETSHTILLPILKNNKFAGLISKMQLLEMYRSKLKEMVIE